MKVDSTVETCPRLPYMCPVSELASTTRRSVMPVRFIRLPAKMNSGIASRVKLCEAATTFCGRMLVGTPGVVR